MMMKQRYSTKCYSLRPLEGLPVESPPGVECHDGGQVLQLLVLLVGGDNGHDVLGRVDAHVVGVLVVLHHVGQQSDHVHGEGQGLARRVDEREVQQEGELAQQLDGRLVGVGVGATLKPGFIFWTPYLGVTLRQCHETSRIFTGTERTFASGEKVILRLT